MTTYCTDCGHRRTLHSRESCVEERCPCPVRYMDKDKFRPVVDTSQVRL